MNNFSGLSRKWVGVKFVHVLHFSWGRRDTHKQNSQEISVKWWDSPGIVPGQSRGKFVYVFSCLLAFSGPNLRWGRTSRPIADLMLHREDQLMLIAGQPRMVILAVHALTIEAGLAIGPSPASSEAFPHA